MVKHAVAILGIVLACSSCAKRTKPLAGARPPAVPEHVRLFEEGLKAFRQFTPEGYMRASDLFRRASQLSPPTCEYRLHLAQSNLFLAYEQQLNRDDFAAALASSEVPECGAGTAFALRLEALRSMYPFSRSSDPEATSKQISEAIQREPENALNWFVGWQVDMSTRRVGSPILEPPDIPSDLAIIHYERGNYWLLRGDFEKARRSFERALEFSPRHFHSYIGLAQAIGSADDDADIAPYLKRAIEIAPHFLDGRIVMGDYYTWSGETELAEEQYVTAIRHNPRFETAHLNLGKTYLEADSLPEAEMSLRTAVEINPRSYKACYYLGNVWMARNDLNKAQEQYETSIGFSPSFPESLHALGVVLAQKGEYDRALEHLDKVIRLRPQYADSYFWRAMIRAERRQFREAIEDYNRAINLFSDQIAEITRSIDKAEVRGFSRRAAAERRKKGKVEASLQNARELKAKAETAQAGF